MLQCENYFLETIDVDQYNIGMKTIILTLILTVSLAYSNEDSLPVVKPIKGVADLHVHMFANLAHSARWTVGDPGTPHEHELFNYCENDANSETPFFKKIFNKINPYVASFVYKDDCVPKNKPFPAWNDLAHQQVWFEDLKEAHEGGVKLMIMSAVHSYVLCKVLPSTSDEFNNCEDRANHVRQLKAANKLIEKLDWAEVALDPLHARKIINENKMAIILSVESANIFDHDDYMEEFKEYYDLGVRTLQLLHQFDNQMGGPAIHKRPLFFANYLRNWFRYGKIQGFDTYTEEYVSQFGTEEIIKNKKGLTDKGKGMVKTMMEHGMPIDLAHMSERSIKDVLSITEKNNFYPVYISHGHFRDVMKSGGLHYFEKSGSVELYKRLAKQKSMLGLRTSSMKVNHYDKSLELSCQGSTQGFAQAFQFGRKETGIDIAFASDLNGFIMQTKPRFSKTDNDYCKNQKHPKLGTDFDLTGLGKISQIPDMVQDLKNLGLNVENLESSVENYIRIWERAIEYQQQKLTVY